MVKEFYDKIGGDYEKAISRMNDDERIKKYLKFFVVDESFINLKTSLKNRDCEQAFNAAHTLKGICQNMSFLHLSNLMHDITEELRNKNIDQATILFEEVSNTYNNVITEIQKII